MKHVSPEQLAQAERYKAARRRINEATSLAAKDVAVAAARARLTKAAMDAAVVEQRRRRVERELREAQITRKCDWVGFIDECRTKGFFQQSRQVLILKEVAEKHGVSIADIKGESRVQHINFARQEAYARLSGEAGLSTLRIGQIIGGRDHSTVVSGRRKHWYRQSRDAARGET